MGAYGDKLLVNKLDDHHLGGLMMVPSRIVDTKMLMECDGYLLRDAYFYVFPIRVVYIKKHDCMCHNRHMRHKKIPFFPVPISS